MKILVIGDSYGLPRWHQYIDRVELYYKDTYPECLRSILLDRYHEDILLVNHCRHVNVSLALLRGEANDVYFLEPDFVVVQLGLVDLWPVYGRNIVPPFADLAGKDPWVDLEQYRENLERFIKFCSSRDELKGIVLVNIPKVSEEQYQRYPASHTRTISYNKILTTLARFPVALVDAYSLVEELGQAAIGSDGIHPTALMSHKLADRIANTIKI